MHMALDPTLDTTVDISTPAQFVWPLPATKLSNASLTWAEWVSRQADTGAGLQYGVAVASAQMVPVQQRSAQYSIMYLDNKTVARLIWPLPATRLPKAHLTWDEWVEAQSNGTTTRQPEETEPKHAA
ncbi:MAG: hypothetical protein ACLQUY_26870 [Ktedonobacterales bacterium]